MMILPKKPIQIAKRLGRPSDAWNAEKLEHDKHEFVGLKVFGLDPVTERDLQALEEMRLPRVVCLEAGIVDKSIPDILR